MQISPDNLRMMDNSCYSLLLFLKQSNSESNSESELLSLYYENRPTSDEVVVKIKSARFFETQCSYATGRAVYVTIV